jgi:hypothetical protein
VGPAVAEQPGVLRRLPVSLLGRNLASQIEAVGIQFEDINTYTNGISTLLVSGDYSIEYNLGPGLQGDLTCAIFPTGSGLAVAGSQHTGLSLHHSFITSATAPFAFALQCLTDSVPGSISPLQPGDTTASLQIIKLK